MGSIEACENERKGLPVNEQGWIAPRAHEADPVNMCTWAMPDGETIDGWYLGLFSSRREDHTHAGRVPSRGRSCQSCRWFEVSLWRTDDDAYVLVRHNVSLVEGENDFVQVHRVSSADALVDVAAMGRSSRPLRALLEATASVDDEVARVAFTTDWDTPTWERGLR